LGKEAGIPFWFSRWRKWLCFEQGLECLILDNLRYVSQMVQIDSQLSDIGCLT
jgi:hypothetical protein